MTDENREDTIARDDAQDDEIAEDNSESPDEFADDSEEEGDYENFNGSGTGEDAAEAWRKAKRIKPITPLNTLLTLGVCIFVPWFAYNSRQDIAYFFASGDPVDLGVADEYRLASAGEHAKAQDFEDNTYVRLRGIPIRHVPIQTNRKILPKKQMLVYQLMGSSVYVQEPLENSKFAAFQSQTSPVPGANTGIEPLDIVGRLRRFDTSDNAKRYTIVRDYFSKKYGTIFCENMSATERQRKAKLLGRGGVALQIMPDGSVLEGATGTHTTLSAITPLQGRKAVVLGADNTMLRTIDAGLTWHSADLPAGVSASDVAYDRASDLLLFGGAHGFVGGNAQNPAGDLKIAQNVSGIAIVPADEASESRVIAVGREGLFETADAHGFRPAQLEQGGRFNAVLYTHGTWLAAGSGNMLVEKPASSLDDSNVAWTRHVSPANADWLSLTEVPGGVIATGTKGAIAMRTSSDGIWHNMAVDDVPGIDFDADLRASAVSKDGKTWVAVGSKGNIVVSRAGEDGAFRPVERISGDSAGYAVVHDMLAGNTVEQSLYEAVKRYTPEDFYDIAYANGTFFAVGSDSTLMQSSDGYSWTRRELHIKHKLLRTVAFVDDMHGAIGGEKGTLLVTEDGGKTWRSKKLSTERSIYDISVSSSFPGGFVFTGAYGLWGFCQGTGDMCYVRSRSGSVHYRAIALAPGAQKNTNLDVVVAGDDVHIDHIQDAPGDKAVYGSLWQTSSASVEDVFAASDELPLAPNEARGQIVLMSTGDGGIYRSFDSGYTFRREETGITSPIRRLAGTDDGVAVWAFDRSGTALEDIRGRGKWHKLSVPESKGFIDGVFVGQNGYLIDEHCVYRKQALSDEIQKLSCADAGYSLVRLAADSAETLKVLAVSKDGAYAVSSLATTPDAPFSAFAPFNVGKTEADSGRLSVRLVTCGGSTAVLDTQSHTLYSGDTQQSGISDAVCVNGAFVFLQTQAIGGRYRLAATGASVLWSMDVDFDTSDARFERRSDGRWWLGMASDNGPAPLILSSNDGVEWAWRTDRVTGYHDVAASQNVAVVVGDDASIIVSDDYGATWSQIRTTATQTLRGVCLSQDGTFGLAVGDGGLVYRSDEDLTRWTKLTFKLDLDFTACTIAEQKDRFQFYLTGKGGAIYTGHSRNMQDGLELIASPVIEDIYDIATLETGEVIAVGGVYQDPANICEDGFIIEVDESPRKVWPTMLILLAMLLFMGYTLRSYIYSFKHRNDFKDYILTGAEHSV